MVSILRRTRRVAPLNTHGTRSLRAAKKQQAAAYVEQIKNLRKDLRAIRVNYKAADADTKPRYEAEFNAAAHFPTPTYPADDIIKYISAANRWQILATAMLIRRGLHRERQFDEHFNKFDAFGMVHEFKYQLKKILKGHRIGTPSSPPRYTSVASEPDSQREYYSEPESNRRYPPLAEANPLPSYSPPPTYKSQPPTYHRGGLRTRTKKRHRRAIY
jgi:hypothetical protein